MGERDGMSGVHLPHSCPGMVAAINDERVPVTYLPKYREFGICVDGGPAVQVVSFCPWCGAPLPQSLRDTFFEQLEDIGLDPESPELPIDFRSDAWWRMRSIK
jgi:hypothetical protein